MKKTLLTIMAFALALTGARASVAINSTNFPDENFLWVVQNDWDTDDDGTLSDEEIAERTHAVLYGVTNFKGIEYFYHITDLLISGLNSDDNPMRNLDLTKFTKLERVEISDYPETTSLDFTKNTNLWSLLISNMYGLTTVQIPASITYLHMYWNPKLTTVNLDACRENLSELHMQDVAIKDVDVSNFKKLHRIYIEGNDAENIYKLNSLNIAGCDELWSISIQYTDIETVTIKDLPEFGEATVSYNDIRKLTVENCPKLVYLDCQDNKLPELHIKKCEAFWRIFASNNYMRTLIIDESPLAEVEAADNQLMWFDLSKVVKDDNVDYAPLKIDNQQPHVTAYKLSPTEVGVKVHERFDPSRVIDLTDNGSAVATREFANYDGTDYFVISTRGTQADDLKGGITYKYDPKWPYPWIDGNSEDNLLPVELTIDKVVKLDSWLKLSSTETLKAKVGEELTAPTYTHSDGYDGVVEWQSSDETVVKVDAKTGELTIVGPGTATITLSGAETDYRTAPVTVTYTVSIETGETVEITIGKNSKTTFCGDKGLDFSGTDDVKAFIATGFDKGSSTIWMTRVKDVPAGVPVMIKGTANETYHVPVTEGGSSYYENMFVGNTTGETLEISETSEDGKYVNYYMSGGQFKSVKGSANIGNNKCYLQLPATFEAEATGEALQVKIAASGKSSFAAPYDLDFTDLGDDLKAFTATGYDKSSKTIWLTRVKKVQKGEGLLLKGTGGETYTIPSAGVQASYVNMIVGNIGDEITINETSEDGDWTNYYLKGGTYMSVSGTANIGKNKSYLQLPTYMLAGARRENAVSMQTSYGIAELETESMPIIFASIGGDGETTGIMDNGQWIMDKASDEWYTISGQRISKPTKQGLYIHNGKKVIVK